MTTVSRIVLGLAVLGGAALTCMSPLVFSAPSQDQENGVLDTPARRTLEKERKDAWVNKRKPHPACPNCFKVDGENSIFESVPGTDYVIARDIPDPAPLEPGEVRADRHPETGEPLWYKGHQAFVGPTDEENVSASLPIPMIQLKRIKYKYEDKLFKIPGVHAVGIGESGIVLSITPALSANRSQIPSTLDGIPVIVQEMEVLKPMSHFNAWYRPLPVGAGIASNYTTPGGGSVGPHVSRDISDVGSCCGLYSLTNSHIIYSPPNVFVSNVNIIQPPGSSTSYGWLGYRFVLTSCPGTFQYCTANAPLNDTKLKPDAAAIGHPFNDGYPMYSPCYGSEKPVRRIQYDVSSYVDGPTGIIRIPTTSNCSSCLKNFGVMSHGNQGGLSQAETSVLFEYVRDQLYFKHGPVDFAGMTTQPGDSGGLVAWNQTRDVVGMVIGGPISSRPTSPTVY